MNAEIPVEHPAPTNDPAAFTVTVVGIVGLCAVVLIAMHILLHAYKKAITQEKPVTDTPDSSDLDAPEPKESVDLGPLTVSAIAAAGTLLQRAAEADRYAAVPSQPAVEQGAYAVGMSAAPPEFSVNDVHLLREQDQNLMQLTMQYEGMVKSPWKLDAEKAGLLGDGDISTNVRLQACILSAMMMPISVAGSQRGTSAKQTMWFMNVGPNKVAAASEAKCKVIHEKLNNAYFHIISVQRANTLKAIASALGLADRESTLHAARCGQTRVLFLTKEEAEQAVEALNKSYMEIVEPELERVLKEIRDEAGR